MELTREQIEHAREGLKRIRSVTGVGCGVDPDALCDAALQAEAMREAIGRIADQTPDEQTRRYALETLAGLAASPEREEGNMSDLVERLKDAAYWAEAESECSDFTEDHQLHQRQLAVTLREAAAALTSRPAIIEEGWVMVPVKLLRDIQSNAAIGEPEWSLIEDQLLRLAALAPGGQNGPDFNQEVNLHADTIAERHDAAGPAVAAPLLDREITIADMHRAADEQLNFRAPPAPAEVAEGAGEDAIVSAIRFIGVKAGIPATVYGEMCHEVRTILRAAPSLSREEWGMIDKAMDFYESCAPIGPNGWFALREKVREASKSRP